jgi:hypothetical protein
MKTEKKERNKEKKLKKNDDKKGKNAKKTTTPLFVNTNLLRRQWKKIVMFCVWLWVSQWVAVY